jgi:hypothetical protein
LKLELEPTILSFCYSHPPLLRAFLLCVSHQTLLLYVSKPLRPPPLLYAHLVACYRWTRCSPHHTLRHSHLSPLYVHNCSHPHLPPLHVSHHMVLLHMLRFETLMSAFSMCASTHTCATATRTALLIIRLLPPPLLTALKREENWIGH